MTLTSRLRFRAPKKLMIYVKELLLTFYNSVFSFCLLIKSPLPRNQNYTPVVARPFT